jgi:hypothetical protein
MRRLGNDDRAANIDGKQPIDMRHIEIGEHSLGRDAGGVADDIEAAELGDRTGYGRRGCRLVGDIGNLDRARGIGQRLDDIAGAYLFLASDQASVRTQPGVTALPSAD